MNPVVKHKKFTGTTNAQGFATISLDNRYNEVIRLTSISNAGYITIFGYYNNNYVMYLGGWSGNFTIYPNTSFTVTVDYYEK